MLRVEVEMVHAADADGRCIAVAQYSPEADVTLLRLYVGSGWLRYGGTIGGFIAQ